MRFVIDECTGTAVANWLQANDHDVFSVYDQSRGMGDTEVLDLAYRENRILITNDKDFGEKVHRELLPHCGVIVLRLRDERAASKIRVLRLLFDGHSDRLADHFVVVSDTHVRFRQS